MRLGVGVGTTMEGRQQGGAIVVVAYDATREHNERELWLTLNGIRMRGDMLNRGDQLVVFGVLHTVTHPMGFQTKACIESFMGGSARAIEEEVAKKVYGFESMLLTSAEQCKDAGVTVVVKVTAGTPTKNVILQEILTCKATWAVLDRHLRKDLKFYQKHLPCKLALIQESLDVQVMNTDIAEIMSMDFSEPTIVSSLSKNVQTEPNEYASVVSSASYNVSDSSNMTSTTLSGYGSSSGSQSFPNKRSTFTTYEATDRPILCAGCGLRSELCIKDSMKLRFSDIQLATSNFSEEKFIGEGGFGRVYKGTLSNGQTIAAKVRKETSNQGYDEFFSEVNILSFARHKNIVMLLGYCRKENYNILVYEFICNKSLAWHLFSESASALEWHKRYAIAIGTAKGLRFLHEECRGGPIIHRDMRPSNILLTHDFVPMLGDFGLARWKSSYESFQTRVVGTSGYLAPEYAENGIVSIRTDVYALGIVLFQLISGKKVANAKQENDEKHLLQWAEPIIESLALHLLIDPRIGDAYDTYELYLMARAAYLCVRRNPEMRPSMEEVVLLLKGESRIRELTKQFNPHYAH